MSNKLSRTAELLDESVELCLTLKASKGDSPLKSVVLDKLEINLRGLRKILRKEFSNKPEGNNRNWKKLENILPKTINLIYKLIATLFCKLYSLRRILKIYKNEWKSSCTFRDYLWIIQNH